MDFHSQDEDHSRLVLMKSVKTFQECLVVYEKEAME
jgi:hypothetical protein